MSAITRVDFNLTEDNLNALKIGSAATSFCLKVLTKQRQSMDLVDAAVTLLQRVICGQTELHPAALTSLRRAVEILLSIGLLQCDAVSAAEYFIRLVKTCIQTDPTWTLAGDSSGFVSVLLARFALSRHGYAEWSKLTEPEMISETKRALENIKLEVYLDDARHNIACFGLAVLVRHYGRYIHDMSDFEALARALVSISNQTATNPNLVVRGLQSPYFNNHPLDLNSLQLLPSHGEQCGSRGETQMTAFLNVLGAYSPSSHKAIDHRCDSIYVLTIESICRIESQEYMNLGLELICSQSLLPATLSDQLASMLSQRHIIAHLVTALGSRNEHIVYLAATQVWFLARLILQSNDQHARARSILLEEFSCHLAEDTPVLEYVQQVQRSMCKCLEYLWSPAGFAQRTSKLPGAAYFTKIREMLCEESAIACYPFRTNGFNDSLQMLHSHISG